MIKKKLTIIVKLVANSYDLHIYRLQYTLYMSALAHKQKLPYDVYNVPSRPQTSMSVRHLAFV